MEEKNYKKIPHKTLLFFAFSLVLPFLRYPKGSRVGPCTYAVLRTATVCRGRFVEAPPGALPVVQRTRPGGGMRPGGSTGRGGRGTSVSYHGRNRQRSFVASLSSSLPPLLPPPPPQLPPPRPAFRVSSSTFVVDRRVVPVPARARPAASSRSARTHARRSSTAHFMSRAY